MTTTKINDEQTAILLDIISDKIIKVAQEIRQTELILYNDVLKNQYDISELDHLKDENKKSWQYIKSLKKTANALKADEYHEDEVS